MRSHKLAAVIAAAVAAVLSLPGSADAQLVKKLKDAAKGAAQNEAAAQVDRLVRDAIRCAVDDPVCVEQAESSGEEVIFVDDEGEIITDEQGVPVTDRDEAMASAPPPPAPGEGVWANYDFVPGEDILFFEDYSNDNVGDFPRRLEFVEGNWDVVEWEGGRYLRATARSGLVAIRLPKTLPERFTIETSVNVVHGNASVRTMPGRAYVGPARDYRGSSVSAERGRAGIRPVANQGPTALSSLESGVWDAVVPLRIMADGDYMKVYLGEQRVANVPNAVFPRTDSLFVSAEWAWESDPILIGPIRIAGGGRDLYDRLEAEGRVATHGILFATNSDRIRPESTPTLKEIGAMLDEHPELRLSIEGHTDADGEEAYNQDLSERRAAAVKRFMVERYGIDEGRLESAGFGESQPVAHNGTPEGKQQNRRVELVRLDG
jgi:outer membrane protein OmpA-like peptidoglycan-associated protein